jgi:CelD/BcsL family acetyltransferase involved in cellulose biosynthesis
MDGSDRPELLTEVGAVEALADEWRAKAERRGNPFVTPEWFLAWLRHCGRGWDPYVAVVRAEDGGLRGLLPLISSNHGARRELRFCPLGDCFHPVADAQDEEAVAVAAAPAVALPDSGFRSLVLERIDGSGGWWRALAAAAPTALATVERGESALTCVGLSGLSWDDYLAARSGKFRNQLRRNQRQLDEEHDVQVRRTRRPEEVADDLGILFSLHDARWAEQPGRSALADPAIREFHLEFAAAALEHGWLRLYVMEIDGVPVAARYGWLIGDRWSNYNSGWDPAWSRRSPGFLLQVHTIKEAIEEGASEYDMLLGAEDYKGRFGSSSRTARDVLLVRQGHPAHLGAAAGVRLRRAWRRLPSRPRARARRIADRLGVRH